MAPLLHGVGGTGAGLTDGFRTGSIAPMPAPFLSYPCAEPSRAFEGSSGARVRAALARGTADPEWAGTARAGDLPARPARRAAAARRRTQWPARAVHGELRGACAGGRDGRAARLPARHPGAGGGGRPGVPRASRPCCGRARCRYRAGRPAAGRGGDGRAGTGRAHVGELDRSAAVVRAGRPRAAAAPRRPAPGVVACRWGVRGPGRRRPNGSSAAGWATPSPRTSSPRPEPGWPASTGRRWWSWTTAASSSSSTTRRCATTTRRTRSATPCRPCAGGDKAGAQASYERLREFWAEVAGKQRTC